MKCYKEGKYRLKISERICILTAKLSEMQLLQNSI